MSTERGDWLAAHTQDLIWWLRNDLYDVVNAECESREAWMTRKERILTGAEKILERVHKLWYEFSRLDPTGSPCPFESSGPSECEDVDERGVSANDD